jgi:murein L,D-transpeptidase YafK
MKSIIAITLILVSGCRAYSNNDFINYELPLGKLIDSLAIDVSAIHIIIDKSDYFLTVMVDSQVIKQYPMVLGGNPVDDKRMQGDQCTPEGKFLVRTKYPHRSWEKFIWIDYPNQESWKKFNVAKASGDIPDDASIGGEIGIHGVPGNADELIDLGVNWTLGCISLKNKDINDFYPYVDAGMLIVINP